MTMSPPRKGSKELFQLCLLLCNHVRELVYVIKASVQTAGQVSRNCHIILPIKSALVVRMIRVDNRYWKFDFFVLPDVLLTVQWYFV
jgi:hypothetical protein